MAVQVGDKAPDFQLINTENKEVKLSDTDGKNRVILFFPLAFTDVCTTELCSIRDNLGDYEALNAEVLAISVDSPFTLAKFKEEQQYNFTLLSDFNAEVSKAYGALYDDFVLNMKNVSKRAAFVLDGKGEIRYAEVLESAGDLPNFDAVQETLQGLQ